MNRFRQFFEDRNREFQRREAATYTDKDEVAHGNVYYPDQVKTFGVDLSAIPTADEGAEDAE